MPELAVCVKELTINRSPLAPVRGLIRFSNPRAGDSDRLARFQREAQVLASLNHPNIAQIFGLEKSPSTSSGQATITALVMELVEGDDLSQRIARLRAPKAIRFLRSD